MCNIWKNPSLPEEEISFNTLAMIPDQVGVVNLTGGEPTLRKDLGEIVDLLYPKVKKLEISSNGLHPEKIEPIIKKYHDIKIRFSLEGNEKTNNTIRGEKNGFHTKVDGLARLKELGGTDLGFAVVVQDDNAADLVELFHYAEANGYELSTSTLHNGFQFHKSDNNPRDRLQIAHHIEGLILEQLKTNNIKNWFRAYINLGLEAKILGKKRLLACRHGYESVFIDPWGDVFACNVRPDLYLGNLGNQAWQDIISGPQVSQVLKKVDQCQQNCWMAGVAKGAMRNPRFTAIPRIEPVAWVIQNKIRLVLGKPIEFQHHADYPVQTDGKPAPMKFSSQSETIKRTIQKKNSQHYSQSGGFFND
jgi:radical SAM protein with 4Fe4S-binding SPASM domain